MFAFSRFARPLFLLAVVFLLAACGGGDSSSSSGPPGPAGPPGSPGTLSLTVSATAGPGGDIGPPTQAVDHGATATLAVTPETGYSIDSVSGCGGSLDGDTYTTGTITGACTVAATFSTIAELMNGSYDGVMRSPKNIFFTDSTSIRFAIDGFDADIIKEAFFGRTCLLDGVLAGAAFPLTGSGTFQCSDFTDGTWTSSKIAKTNATASLSEITMTAGSDVYTIKVAGFHGAPVAGYDSDLDYWVKDADLGYFSGSFDGNLQSLDPCAALTFATSSTDLSIAINDGEIVLEQDAFFEGVCRFEGNIDGFEDGVIKASGDYQCSNFDTGAWSTDRLVMTGADSMFAELFVDVPSRGCGYTVKYLGFKALHPEPDPVEPDPVEPEASSLVSCGFFGCQAVALPFNQNANNNLNIIPIPDWYTLGEFRLSAGSEDVIISNIRAQAISGGVDSTRIDGLAEGVLAAGEQVLFKLQSTRSTTSSTIEFAFDIHLIPGSPSTFFSAVTVTTN